LAGGILIWEEKNESKGKLTFGSHDNSRKGNLSMSKRKGRVFLTALLVGTSLLLVGGIAFVTFGQQGEPAMPEIPGITVDDVKVSGCVDCHYKESDERDYRLSTSLGELVEEGKHPDVSAMVNTIPDDCVMCHSEQMAEGMGTEPLGPMMHKIHLVGGAENHFIAGYQGQCTHCHGFNEETGGFSIKSGEEG
jgi:hypothetical protein